jgi:hypothetical protein
MPFKSKAQRRKFAEMMVKGEISEETFEEWNRETGSAELPERVTPQSPKKRGRKTTVRKAAKKKSTRKRATSAKKSTRKRARKASR